MYNEPMPHDWYTQMKHASSEYFMDRAVISRHMLKLKPGSATS